MPARRVLFLTDTLHNGGAERQLTLLARHLPAEWEARIWSTDNGPYAEVIRRHGIWLQVRERTWHSDIRPFADLWKLVLRWRPDVVHSWGTLCSAMAAPLCMVLRIPRIDGFVRGGARFRRHGLRARLLMALADRVIGNSVAGLRARGAPMHKSRVIYNAFDPERLPLTERPATRDPHPFTVVMAARMMPVKDFASFVGCARLLHSQNSSPWHFLALGSGPERETLLAGASDLLEAGVIAFPDAGLEVLPYLRNADAGVLMTNPALHAEGCSNSIMEYMACGLPVICSDGGGNRELVIDGTTGFIVPPRSVEALAERLVWLRENPELAARMGQAGRERILNEFTIDKLVRATVSVYEEVLRQDDRG